jgi:hypothetical protein
MVVRSMETAVEAMESMEMAPGALPHPDRVPEQRLLPPESRRRWWWSCGTSSRKLLIDLGFLRRRPFIGGRAMLEGSQGPHTWWWRSQEGTHVTLWCASLLAPHPALLRTLSRVGKIGGSAFVLSNSENIFCVAFLKHKNSKK